MKSKTGQKGKDAMKWMIASDLHGSAYYVEWLIRAFHQEETVGLPEHFTSILRDYQKAGFYWLKKQ